MSDKSVSLRWTGEGLRFVGGAAGGPEIQLDSAGAEGPSPMDALLLSVAGCMAIDVVMILQKGRVPLTSMEIEVEGDRAQEPPRRFTAVRIVYRIGGLRKEHHARAQRAVELSRDRYCSVLHTLRSDVDLDIRIDHL
ncbi:MAG: OsmC family protein [Gemmatimonadota bacterium]